jgi:hypothetical protein
MPWMAMPGAAHATPSARVGAPRSQHLASPTRTPYSEVGGLPAPHLVPHTTVGFRRLSSSYTDRGTFLKQEWQVPGRLRAPM